MSYPQIPLLPEIPVFSVAEPIRFTDGCEYKTFMLGDYRYAWCSMHGTIAVVHSRVWIDAIAMMLYRGHDRHQHGGGE